MPRRGRSGGAVAPVKKKVVEEVVMEEVEESSEAEAVEESDEEEMENGSEDEMEDVDDGDEDGGDEDSECDVVVNDSDLEDLEGDSEIEMADNGQRLQVNLEALGSTTTGEDGVLFDLGHLMATNYKNVSAEDLKANKNEALHARATEDAQALFDKVFSLPVERLAEVAGAVVTLPPHKLQLPRQKPVPAEKAKTRWEKFAEVRDIQKRKRSLKEWDEETQSWKRRYGYDRANNEMSEWVIEAKDTDEPGKDPWQERKKAKKERVEKGMKQQVRNVEETQKYMVKAGHQADKPRDASAKKSLERAIISTKSATASVGKFQKSLPKEPKEKGVRKQREAVVAGKDFAKNEKEKNLKMLERMLNKGPLLDVDKAVSVNKLQQERARREAKMAEGEGAAAKGKGKGKTGGGRGGGRGRGRGRGGSRGGRGGR